MSEIICIRLLHESSKSEGLLTSICAINEGRETAALFAVDSASFNEVPNAPFSYAIEERVRKLFKELPPFEKAERTARVGLQTSDDFRFVRCWWEVGLQFCKEEPKFWIPFAKGGFYSPYYADLFLVINWKDNGKELKAFSGSVIRNDQYYGSPGLTWSEATTKEFGCRPLPAGCIYSHVGLGIFQDKESKLIGTQVILNSPQLRALMGISLGLADVGRRHYTAGTIQRLPIAVFDAAQSEAFNDIGYRAWDAQRGRDFNNEISHFYISPYGLCAPDKLDADQRKLDEQQIWRRGEVSKLEQRASELIAKVYGFTAATPGAPPDEELADVEESRVGQSLEKALISYLVGLAFGRWKIVDDPEAAKQAYGDDPFAPLPPYAAAFNARPGTGEQAVFLEGDSLYQSIRQELIGFFGEAKAPSIEGQLCAMLSVGSLDEYLHRPTGFFADHVSQYSESRRQAPIYWPISTKSGSLTIWLYYPRLNKDTLARLITEVLDPKLRRTNEELAALSGQAKAGQRKAELELFAQELSEMKGDFQRLIEAGYLPNLDDGVLITASPLAKFFRYPKFRKDLEGCWKELARGDYDWAHLAMAMWPERVLKACRADRSIAIAHRREDLCPPEAPRPTRGRRPSA
ncbi:MAG: hypothetical protein ORN83_16875 [Chthoniobacteraceae bacterium]|nr:hypothetical protein [Chthoniobacteraceae bacterium]